MELGKHYKGILFKFKCLELNNLDLALLFVSFFSFFFNFSVSAKLMLLSIFIMFNYLSNLDKWYPLLLARIVHNLLGSHFCRAWPLDSYEEEFGFNHFKKWKFITNRKLRNQFNNVICTFIKFFQKSNEYLISSMIIFQLFIQQAKFPCLIFYYVFVFFSVFCAENIWVHVITCYVLVSKLIFLMIDKSFFEFKTRLSKHCKELNNDDVKIVITRKNIKILTYWLIRNYPYPEKYLKLENSRISLDNIYMKDRLCDRILEIDESISYYEDDHLILPLKTFNSCHN